MKSIRYHSKQQKSVNTIQKDGKRRCYSLQAAKDGGQVVETRKAYIDGFKMNIDRLLTSLK
jgi:hypothetical protein